MNIDETLELENHIHNLLIKDPRYSEQQARQVANHMRKALQRGIHLDGVYSDGDGLGIDDGYWTPAQEEAHNVYDICFPVWTWQEYQMYEQRPKEWAEAINKLEESEQER